MKRQYIKPLILVEDFILSSSVAGSCDNSGQAFTDTCAQNYTLEAVMDALDIMDGQLDGNIPEYGSATEFDITLLDGQEVKVCYHTSQGINVFTS